MATWIQSRRPHLLPVRNMRNKEIMTCSNIRYNKKDIAGQQKIPSANKLSGFQINIKYYQYCKQIYNVQICNQDMI